MANQMKTLEDLIEYMKDNKVNPLVVDAWNEDPTRYPIYSLMKKLYDDRETREVIVGNFKIKIDFTPGRNSGMASEPDEYRTIVLVNFGA